MPRDRSHSTIPGKIVAGWHTAEVPQPDPFPAAGAADRRLSRLLTAPGRRDRLTHVERVPARAGRPVDWPAWAHPDLVRALAAAGIDAPWSHQAAAAELVRAGRSTVLATGTASGKSLSYLLPALTAVLDAEDAGGLATPPTTLYLSPTKALAADQLRALGGLGLEAVRAATYDGDTPPESRDWVRRHASYVLTNPDMLHRSILPGHPRWARFLRDLDYVVVDECHRYRGVFGSHVAAVLRRLRRVCARYGADPVFVLASATVSDPEVSAARLVGHDVVPVTDDGSPRGELLFALWEPPLTELAGENKAPVRRSATAEVADLLADLVADGVRTVAFVRSRRAAETVSSTTRRLLAEISPDLPDRVAAYRAGYLPEERRALERGLRAGELLGVAATSALELGVDISGLDATITAGFPGTLASLWQQAGRAGRDGQRSLAVLVARDDPLDTYLVHHPEAVFGRPVEASVFDPDNPYVLAPQLECAAAELPLAESDLELFGPAAHRVIDDLVRRGRLRRRAAGWYWTQRARPDLDIRGTGGPPVRIVETATGRLLGTVDASAAHSAVHPGAVYLHQGTSFVVDDLNLAESVAFVREEAPEWTTIAREHTDIRIVESTRSRTLPDLEVHLGVVEVTNQVVGYQRRLVATGEILGQEPLDLPPRQLRTRAVWYTVTEGLLADAAIEPADVPGAVHAAEHAAIGLLPLFATCDRWDIGGVSTALHPDTGRTSVFVYDGHAGGAGFAERGFLRVAAWLGATRDAVRACECPAGCPSCVQSPKCGNGNEPLDKAAAWRLLAAVTAVLD